MKIMNKKKFIVTSLLFFLIALGTTAISFSAPPGGSGPENPASIANVVVVAKTGGDFDSIQAAVDSITPTADKPYLIEVMPATYIENITMKSHVHIQGAGADVTFVQAGTAANETFTLTDISSVTISGFNIRSDEQVGTGIWMISSSPTIKDNIFSEGKWGIYSENSSSPIIVNNIFDNLAPNKYGITNYNSDPTVLENIFKGDNSGGIGIENNQSSATIVNNKIFKVGDYGIWNKASSTKIQGNTIIGQGNHISDESGSSSTITGNIISGSRYEGIYLTNPSGIIITNNTITNNAVDIYTNGNCNVSFNIYDTIAGSGLCSGSYNVKSDGTPW